MANGCGSPFYARADHCAVQQHRRGWPIDRFRACSRWQSRHCRPQPGGDHPSGSERSAHGRMGAEIWSRPRRLRPGWHQSRRRWMGSSGSRRAADHAPRRSGTRVAGTHHRPGPAGNLPAKWSGDRPPRQSVDGGHRTHRVVIFDADGAMSDALGDTGTDLGKFRQPMFLAVASDGGFFVTDWENSRVQHFDADQRPTAFWPVPARAWGIAVDPTGRVFVPDVDHKEVLIFSSGRRHASRNRRGPSLADTTRQYHPARGEPGRSASLGAGFERSRFRRPGAICGFETSIECFKQAAARRARRSASAGRRSQRRLASSRSVVCTPSDCNCLTRRARDGTSTNRTRCFASFFGALALDFDAGMGRSRLSRADRRRRTVPARA